MKALAGWLGISIHDLYDYDKGESAKSLMVWVGNCLWTDPRLIQGKVLKAVLKKLGIPLSTDFPIPDEPICPPRTPCFPFLVSLRSFLLRCKEEKPAVSEIRFIQNDDKYTFRLMMKREFSNHTKFEKRFRETLCKDGKTHSPVHTFTRSLRYLIYCKTEGWTHSIVTHSIGRDYMRLFTEGTEDPVVDVEIAPDHIDLIWQC